jgi:hypothetical protein
MRQAIYASIQKVFTEKPSTNFDSITRALIHDVTYGDGEERELAGSSLTGGPLTREVMRKVFGSAV